MSPTYSDVTAARERIRDQVRRTPVMTCTGVDEAAGARVFLKCENLQRTGAFKFRGASNAVWQLDADECARGVATHSSGNHGAALALAARTRGIPAIVVMPENSVQSKIEAVRGYGADLRFCGPSLAHREAMLAEVVDETGAIAVPPYDDARIIAGQGTAALELLDEVPDLQCVLVPVGGGGLLAGTALVGEQRDIRVFGAEPETASDAKQSLVAGRRVATTPDTIADGLRATIGVLNFAVVRDRVEDIVTVSEAEIIGAMKLIWQRAKLIIEPSAAVPIAALLRDRRFRDRRVGVVLSGGNLDLDTLPWQPKFGRRS